MLKVIAFNVAFAIVILGFLLLESSFRYSKFVMLPNSSLLIKSSHSNDSHFIKHSTYPARIVKSEGFEIFPARMSYTRLFRSDQQGVVHLGQVQNNFTLELDIAESSCPADSFQFSVQQTMNILDYPYLVQSNKFECLKNTSLRVFLQPNELLDISLKFEGVKYVDHSPPAKLFGARGSGKGALASEDPNNKESKKNGITQYHEARAGSTQKNKGHGGKHLLSRMKSFEKELYGSIALDLTRRRQASALSLLERREPLCFVKVAAVLSYDAWFPKDETLQGNDSEIFGAVQEKANHALQFKPPFVLYNPDSEFLNYITLAGKQHEGKWLLAVLIWSSVFISSVLCTLTERQQEQETPQEPIQPAVTQ